MTACHPLIFADTFSAFLAVIKCIITVTTAVSNCKLACHIHLQSCELARGPSRVAPAFPRAGCSAPFGETQAPVDKTTISYGTLTSLLMQLYYISTQLAAAVVAPPPQRTRTAKFRSVPVITHQRFISCVGAWARSCDRLLSAHAGLWQNSAALKPLRFQSFLGDSEVTVWTPHGARNNWKL